MTVETQEKITVDMLTKDSVSILRQQFATINDQETQIGENFRRAYSNTEEGRRQLIEEVGEPYTSAVFAMWGDSPMQSEEI